MGNIVRGIGGGDEGEFEDDIAVTDGGVTRASTFGGGEYFQSRLII
ncbi:hypothetical protein [Rubritalea tangerina]